MKWFQSALFVFLLAAAVACGDDGGESGQRMVDDPAPKKKTAEEEAAGKILENKAWNEIKPYFLGLENDIQTGFVRGPVQTIRDPFEDQLVKWIPKIELPEEPEVAVENAAPDEMEVVAPEVEVVPPGETQRFAVQDYKILLIRWGTSVNKALVQDPEGTEFMITKDMKLGDGNGRVTDITRYDVVVKEDSREEPIVLTIRPELMQLGETGPGSDRLFINQTRE